MVSLQFSDIRTSILFSECQRSESSQNQTLCSWKNWLTFLFNSHCDTCKSLGGGAYSLNQIIPKSDLKVTKGNLRAYTYQGASGKNVYCYHCANCTTHAYHQQEAMGPDLIVVRTIPLEGGDKFPAKLEIFAKARLDWQPEVAQSFETMPN